MCEPQGKAFNENFDGGGVGDNVHDTSNRAHISRLIEIRDQEPFILSCLHILKTAENSNEASIAGSGGNR